MRFGDFYTRICEHLKSGYNWKGAIMYLACHPELLDIMFDEYNKAIHSGTDGNSEWRNIVESTALKLEQVDKNKTS